MDDAGAAETRETRSVSCASAGKRESIDESREWEEAGVKLR